MLNSLYELGKLWIEREDLNPIDVFLDAEKLKRSTKRVILVELDEISENQLKFSKISLKEYNPKDNLKYLYRSGSSRGTDITPSCLITELERTFNNKFFKWFEQNNDDDFLKAILNCLTDDKELIFDEILSVFNGLANSESNNVILTLAINSNDSFNYIGDYDIFKDILISKASEKYYKKDSKQIKGLGHCFLCDDEKEVFGLVSNSIGFAFSTPDKKGNVSDFNVENQWKQLPICGECALYLEAGKKFVEKYLSFREYGLTYYVIPNFLFDSKKAFNKLFNRIKRFENKMSYDDVAVAENKINDIVSDLNDVLEFKFLFFQASNNAFNILSYVESIIPSWMNKLYISQKEIIKLELFSEEYMKKIFSNEASGNFIKLLMGIEKEKIYPVLDNKWYVGFLRSFFSGYSFKIYLDLVSSVLSEKKLDFNFLLSRFMDEIRKNWRKEKNYQVKIDLFKSLSLFLLFNNLNLLKGGNFMLEEDVNLTYDVIDKILNTPDKKASFLLGSLTRRLTYKQYKELGSSPFINKLWGLSLDEKKIQKLYPMVLNKLREYDSAYPKLEQSISLNLLNAENNWKLTRDETSYYFTLGYTLAYAISNNKENNQNDKK
ncbi:CRISPR-associated protein, Csh1 family [Methanobrevibacter olleyae]|uniref:CRISPR-associated protein, Csh1 family n=1 Tax=Methanobrevibacter olleyae TaxID=294671 RepID=A0A1I4K804_METOL|nr:TIGR02556 family CRISPR-associated protein [Methanobrevibacter olleyae]SFL74616.1 CRISPR-associated protein, Csh1 family [Methanobrevibacter olleyae]